MEIDSWSPPVEGGRRGWEGRERSVQETIHEDSYTLRLIRGDLSIQEGGVLCPQDSEAKKRHKVEGSSRTKQRKGPRVGSRLGGTHIGCVVLEFPNPQLRFLISLTGCFD